MSRYGTAYRAEVFYYHYAHNRVDDTEDGSKKKMTMFSLTAKLAFQSSRGYLDAKAN